MYVELGAVENLYSSPKKAFYELDVEGAFIYLLSELEKSWNKADFHSLQDVCLRDTRLPENVKNKIEEATTLRRVINI